jgi:hypothetical protein
MRIPTNAKCVRLFVINVSNQSIHIAKSVKCMLKTLITRDGMGRKWVKAFEHDRTNIHEEERSGDFQSF